MTGVLSVLVIVSFVLILQISPRTRWLLRYTQRLKLRSQLRLACLGSLVLDAYATSWAGGGFNDAWYGLHLRRNCPCLSCERPNQAPRKGGHTDHPTQCPRMRHLSALAEARRSRGRNECRAFRELRRYPRECARAILPPCPEDQRPASGRSCRPERHLGVLLAVRVLWSGSFVPSNVIKMEREVRQADALPGPNTPSFSGQFPVALSGLPWPSVPQMSAAQEVLALLRSTGRQ